MKKIIAMFATIVTLMSLSSCKTNEKRVVLPETPTTTETETDVSYVEFSTTELDSDMKECFGEDLILTEYSEGIYYVACAPNGIHAALKSGDLDSVVDLLCSIDELSETIHDVFEVDSVFFVHDDVDESLIYATLNGEDITDILT